MRRDAAPELASQPALAWLPRRLPRSLCVLCRTWCADGLCEACVQRFAAPRPRCLRCARATAAPLAACGGCLREPPAFERSVTLADYGAPWPALITAFKFRQQIELASALAAGLVCAVRREHAVLPDLVVPVPLTAARLRERGFNQAWEIARRAARRLRRRASRAVLQRVRETAHQIGMTRGERERNLRDAFWVDARGRTSLAGLRVALVDDVMTTGATAHAASLALRRSGAAAVDLWVLARTPLDDD
ncbi:MAG: ComF family protein [Burkholderiaceae bacterium]